MGVMSMWNNHRARQAGKYTKKAYHLAQMQVAHEQHLARVALDQQAVRMSAEQQLYAYWYGQGKQCARGERHYVPNVRMYYDWFVAGWHAQKMQPKLPVAQSLKTW